MSRKTAPFLHIREERMAQEAVPSQISIISSHNGTTPSRWRVSVSSKPSSRERAADLLSATSLRWTLPSAALDSW